MTKEIMNAVNTQIFGVWFLIGAALVFWMQAGFAMVEPDLQELRMPETLS